MCSRSPISGLNRSSVPGRDEGGGLGSPRLGPGRVVNMSRTCRFVEGRGRVGDGKTRGYRGRTCERVLSLPSRSFPCRCPRTREDLSCPSPSSTTTSVADFYSSFFGPSAHPHVPCTTSSYPQSPVPTSSYQPSWDGTVPPRLHPCALSSATSSGFQCLCF